MHARTLRRVSTENSCILYPRPQNPLLCASMSSASTKSQAKLARQTVTTWIDKFERSKQTPHGLPEDVLRHALEGYGAESLTWPSLRSKAQDFNRYVTSHVTDCTIHRVLRRPIGRKEPGASVSIYRLMAKPLRQAETLFGANTYTFTFWCSGLWFLSTTDPLFTTDHFHQRLVERAIRRHESLAEAQDSLSILWPMLLELGEQRRKQGRRANVTNFISPLADGLIFGEMQKLVMNTEMTELAAPELIDFQNGLALTHRLFDFFCNGDKRLLILVRTFVGSDKLKDTQRRLKEALDRYVRRHSVVIECLRNRSRLAFDADAPYGPVHHDLFVVPQPSATDYQRALAELDAITSSDDWRSEIDRSIENRSRRHKEP